MIYPVSFTANFVANANIKCREDGKKFVNKKAKIVELDVNNGMDLLSLATVSRMWDNPTNCNYSRGILRSVTNKESCDCDNAHYYALTIQNDNFENLDPNKILGLAMFSEYYNIFGNELSYLQVAPSECYSISGKTRKYANVGAALVKYLQKKYRREPIFVSSSETALEFYRKLDFISGKYDDYELKYFA